MDDMDLSEVHEFHFVIARSMKKGLENLDMFKGYRSLSGIIVKVLSLLAPVVKREHQWGEQRMSRYMYVSLNPGEIRDHVHAYLPVDVYRELKLIHQDLNFPILDDPGIKNHLTTQITTKTYINVLFSHISPTLM